MEEDVTVAPRWTSPAVALWGSNAVSCVLVVINTLSWGYAIRAVGLFEPTTAFFIALGTTPWFYLALGSGFVGLFVTYHGQVSIGIAKAALFYNTGTVALLLTTHFILSEAYNLQELVGVAAIMVGGFMVSDTHERIG